jgi:hypothetical protein
VGYQDSGPRESADGDVIRFGSERPPPGRPWLRGALAAAVVGALVVVAVARSIHHAPSRPAAKPSPPPVVVRGAGRRLLGVTAGWELFGRGINYLVSIQPATGIVSLTMVPPLQSNNSDVALIVGPHQAVIRSYDEVPGYLVPDGMPAQPLAGPLATDSPGPVIPGPHPGQAWVQWVQPANQANQALLLVNGNGKLAGQSIRLPPHALPATAVSDGRGYVLLLTTSNALYDAGPTWDHRISAQILAVGPTAWLGLACSRPGQCHNVVIDPATGAQRVLPGPAVQDALTFAWPTVGVTSPDGTTAAVAVFSHGSTVTVRLINLRTGVSTPVPVQLNNAPGYQTMAWSPDSRWLFVVAGGTRLVAVSEHAGQVRSLGVTLPAISEVAVRAAPGEATSANLAIAPGVAGPLPPPGTVP